MIEVVTYLDFLLNEILSRLTAIITAPYVYPHMLWIILPLLLSLLFTEFYFSRYTYEELGWGSAFGNALVLIFVSLDLLRYLYGQGFLYVFDLKTILAVCVAMEGLF